MKLRRGPLELKKYPRQDRENVWEIVRWYPNPYYGKEGEYIKNGEYYSKEGSFCYIHENCFINKESCYVVALIEDGIPDFCGDRTWKLETKQELIDFLKLLKKGVAKTKPKA